MKKIIFCTILIAQFLSCSNSEMDDANNFLVKNDDQGELKSFENLRVKAEETNDIEDWINLASFCKEESNFECALDAAAKSFRLDSTNLEARKLYAWSLINKPEPPLIDIERAKRHFKYVLSIQPKEAQTMIELANAYSLTGDFENSFLLINNALKINDRLRDAYILKGSNYRVVGNYKLALSSYQTAVQMDPDHFMSNLQTAYLLTEMENHQLALEYYMNAVSIKPESIEAIYGVAKSYQDMGLYDEAQATYRNLLDVDNRFFIAYFNQGFIKQYYINELDSAAYYYNLCLEVQPEYVKAWHQLGETYRVQGRNYEAAKAYTEVLQLNPNYEPTLVAKEKLRKAK